MKWIKCYFFFFFIIVLNSNLSAQTTYTYFFNGNFNESGSGPALSEVLSCGATNGSFTTQTITTSAGSCSATAQPVFAFNQGGGLAFPNNSTIGSTYTINIFFKFNALGGYQRIIDFLDGSTDIGLYTLNDCLNFYNNGNVGTCPFFVANQFYLLTLVRDGATNIVTVYVNGTAFGSYTDAGNAYVPATTTTPIIFFRDNIASSAQCENRDGSIKYLSVSTSASTSTDVGNTWANVCSIVLPVQLSSFAAQKDGNAVVLKWKVEDPSEVKDFEIERSTADNHFSTISSIQANNSAASGSYIYKDATPDHPISQYRLKINDKNGSYKYSPVVKINFEKLDKMQLYPNPTKDLVVITGISSGKTISLINFEGKILMQQVSIGESVTINLDKLPAGIYVMEYHDGSVVQRQQIIKQ